SNLLVFGRLLRRLGLDVHPGRMLDVAEALQLVDIRVRDEGYHACRALLVHRHEDLAVFDRAFDAFWHRSHSHRAALDTEGTQDIDRLPAKTPVEQNVSSVHQNWSSVRQYSSALHRNSSSAHEDSASSVPGWSDAEALARKDFAEFTDEEMTLAHAA